MIRWNTYPAGSAGSQGHRNPLDPTDSNAGFRFGSQPSSSMSAAAGWGWDFNYCLLQSRGYWNPLSAKGRDSSDGGSGAAIHRDNRRVYCAVASLVREEWGRVAGFTIARSRVESL